MNQLGLTIDTNMALHAKVPFVAFLRLVHLRVALACENVQNHYRRAFADALRPTPCSFI